MRLHTYMYMYIGAIRRQDGSAWTRRREHITGCTLGICVSVEV